MGDLVMNMLNVSVQAALIFGVLLAVRGLFALAGAPKKFAYGLWAILFIRLLLPVQLESGWGLMPRESGLLRAIEEMRQEWESGRRESAVSTPVRNVGNVYSQAQDGEADQGQTGNAQPDFVMGEGAAWHRVQDTDYGKEETRDNSFPGGAGGERFSVWLIGIWAAGVMLLWGHGFFSCLLLKRRLIASLSLKNCGGAMAGFAAHPKGGREEIYLADGISSPFVLGFFRPRIYLPSDMEEMHYPYVIAHERVHIRRRDYLLKPGAYLLACLYWFHPLVWVGYVLMCRDMEMSCDEAVLEESKGDCREAYADSLLRLTCGKRYPAGIPLSFGEGDTRGRILHIMQYKKPAILVAVGAAALTVVLAVLLLTSPRQDEGGDVHPGGSLAGEDGTAVQSPGESTVGEGGVAGQSPGEPSAEEDGEGGSSVEFRVLYEEISCPVPEQTGYTSLGADGAILDSVDGETVIFHGYFGLYVYSVSAGEIVGAVDLRVLGCGATQGDNACQVLVGKNGSKVYFYPMGGMEIAKRLPADSSAEPAGATDQEEEGQTWALYEYEIDGGRLRLMTSDLWEPRQFYSREGIRALAGEELSESQAVSWEECGAGTAAFQGYRSDYCMRFYRDDQLSCGYLTSASGMLEDLVYVCGPWARQIGGGMKYMQLFGGEGRRGSVASFGPEPTRLTIDGAEYDLARSMTRILVGDQVVENPEGADLVNSIYALYSLDGCWVAVGHIGPDRNTYSIYDPGEKQWVYHMAGACLAWSDRPEDMENAREKSRLLVTGIYALDNVIYTVRGERLTAVELAQGEYIMGLERAGNEVTVIISTDDEEGSYRTIQFAYSVSSSSGVVELRWHPS